MQHAQAHLLADGKRLHLQHGPIDLIVEAFGAGREAAYHRATRRFETVLEELVGELSLLRRRVSRQTPPKGQVARRMHAAVLPLGAQFVTPMAAVAGAVADEVLCCLCDGVSLRKAYVNNGGDVAFHLERGETIEAAIAAAAGGRISITSGMPHRGVATSGWRGRSHSLGIADSVTAVARNAATADAAATLIANAVDLPGSARIRRIPARQLAPDSDLGDRPVTVAVERLSSAEVEAALAAGCGKARKLLDHGLIGGAVLELQGVVCLAGPVSTLPGARAPASKPESIHA